MRFESAISSEPSLSRNRKTKSLLSPNPDADEAEYRQGLWAVPKREIRPDQRATRAGLPAVFSLSRATTKLWVCALRPERGMDFELRGDFRFAPATRRARSTSLNLLQFLLDEPKVCGLSAVLRREIHGDRLPTPLKGGF